MSKPLLPSSSSSIPVGAPTARRDTLRDMTTAAYRMGARDTMQRLESGDLRAYKDAEYFVQERGPLTEDEYGRMAWEVVEAAMKATTGPSRETLLKDAWFAVKSRRIPVSDESKPAKLLEELPPEVFYQEYEDALLQEMRSFMSDEESQKSEEVEIVAAMGGRGHSISKDEQPTKPDPLFLQCIGHSAVR